MGTRILLFSGKEVIQVLLEFGAVVERASVDEAYVDLTRSETFGITPGYLRAHLDNQINSVRLICIGYV